MAVVSPMVALSLPAGEVLPATSVRVAVTVKVTPSAGRAYSKLRLPTRIWAALKITVWPSVRLSGTVRVSPATAPVGMPTITPTVVPIISVRLMVLSLLLSSVMMTTGAAVVPSLSVMLPVPATPPMVRLNVSAVSMVVSLTVGTVTVKLVTPAGTLTKPVTLL